MVSEHNAKYAILNLAETPEEAYEMIDYLKTLDWHQIFTEREQREKRYIQEVLEKGGGYCDECKEITDRLIPGSFADRFRIRQGSYCWNCIKSLEKYYDVPKEDRICECDSCHIVARPKMLVHHPKIADRYWGYCPSCLETIIQRKTITCAICGIQTLDHAYSREVCDDCYIKYPYQTSISYHLTRAKEAKTEATLTLAQWVKAVNYFDNKCAYCSIRPFQVLEHFVPITLGGGTSVQNCVPACESCNNRKSSRHPNDFVYSFPAENIARIRGYFESVSSLALR